MVHVTTKLLCCEFPVTGNNPLLYTWNHLSACLSTVEHVVHVELRLAEICIKVYGVFIPVGKNQTFVGFYSSL
ncbi:hypothetical protein SDC9_143789 [bioreactor metagenome]|uniref:Uncharacterized protein n=1 Tax=bioreactor metagenome TaxID=1076179 RepID=A0A645E4B6_9ZZZZ